MKYILSAIINLLACILLLIMQIYGIQIFLGSIFIIFPIIILIASVLGIISAIKLLFLYNKEGIKSLDLIKLFKINLTINIISVSLLFLIFYLIIDFLNTIF